MFGEARQMNSEVNLIRSISVYWDDEGGQINHFNRNYQNPDFFQLILTLLCLYFVIQRRCGVKT